MNKEIIAKKITIFSGVFFIAILLNTYPALMTEFQRYFSMSVGKSGVIPFFSSMGTISANILAIYLLAKKGTKIGLKLGFLTAFLGLLFASILGFYPLIFGIFLISMTFGLIMTSLSTTYSHLPLKHQDFSMYHSFFGIGGLIAPIIVKFILGKGLTYNYVYLSYFVIFLIVLFLFVSHPFENYKTENYSINDFKKAVLNKKIVILVLLLGFYAASEMSIVVWTGNFYKSVHKIGIKKYSLILSMFWLIFTVSRFFGNKKIKKLGVQKNIIIMSVLTILCVGIMLFFPFKYSVIFFGLTAFFMATLFPSFHFLINYIADNNVKGVVNGVLFLVVSIIGLFFVPFVGIIADINIYYAFGIILLPFVVQATVLPLICRENIKI
ncbi:fucose: H+ symporter, FHS Family, MFS superfamily [Thermotomaculum hydrothermale]|uniref:Fucose: H+ symporter, FHS Family, MFS superfamily n=1 Tax=Thermotomaculum hydrothermale TaxID=981385 RepID=A0A7R6SZM3_9BACT|nr:MFS transporter [Thermotomaculum hydrothermale]BBB32897.1 fucose: H+ symporter, FHS Family, MFS superfamily [Thermotomaculum hydrothermale]